MIVFLDTSEALDICAAELGLDRGCVKQLVTPLTAFNRQKPHDEFAIDNGAFAGFRKESFLRLLERENEARHLCKFVSVPDVVGSAIRTHEIFNYWKYKLPGWPLAYVAQNGQERQPIPWKHIQALFIGGKDKNDGQGDWKLSVHAVECIRAAQALGKWVHVGRVNTPGRFEYFENLGVDSIDGTGLSRYTWMREAIWKQMQQPNLLTGLVPDVELFFPRLDSELSTAETVPETTAVLGSGSGE